MEEFKFTKEQLIEAFKIYNSEYLANPESFSELTADKETAILQAEKLLSILKTL